MRRKTAPSVSQASTRRLPAHFGQEKTSNGVRDDINVYGAKTSSTRGAHNFTSDHELAWELLRYVDAESARRYAEEARQKSP